MSRYSFKADRIKKHYLDGHKFDSEFELKVYKYLRTLFKPDELVVHGKFMIAPGQKVSHHMQWDYDFYIPELDLYVEPKGLTTDKAKVRFAFMRNLHPEEFKKILFVTNKIPKKPKCIIRDVYPISYLNMVGEFRKMGYVPQY